MTRQSDDFTDLVAELREEIEKFKRYHGYNWTWPKAAESLLAALPDSAVSGALAPLTMFMSGKTGQRGGLYYPWRDGASVSEEAIDTVLDALTPTALSRADARVALQAAAPILFRDELEKRDREIARLKDRIEKLLKNHIAKAMKGRIGA